MSVLDMTGGIVLVVLLALTALALLPVRKDMASSAERRVGGGRGGDHG